MATIAPSLPLRDHIAAGVVATVVQVLILLPVLLWSPGGSSGRSTPSGGSPAEGAGRIAVVLLPPEKKAASTPPPPISNAIEHLVSTEPPPAQELVQAGAGMSARTVVVPADQASPPGNVLAGNSTDTPGRDASHDNQDDAYMTAVRASIAHAWQEQGGRALPAGCEIMVDQLAGGKAIRAWTMNCDALPMPDRIRLEIAVMQTQLPYAGYESMFRTHLKLAF